MTTALVLLLVALGGLVVRALRRAGRVFDAAVHDEVDDPRRNQLHHPDPDPKGTP